MRWVSILDADLLAIPEMTLIDRFGRFGYDLFRKARGIHNSPVKSHRIRKSIGKERTYRKLLYAEDDILEEITNLSSKVAQSLEKHGKQGKTLVLKVRYGDFTTLTKRITLTEPTRDAERINRSARHIFSRNRIDKYRNPPLGCHHDQFSSIILNCLW